MTDPAKLVPGPLLRQDEYDYILDDPRCLECGHKKAFHQDGGYSACVVCVTMVKTACHGRYEGDSL